MKKNIVALVMICSSVMALAVGAPAKAQMSKNTIGPSLLIGNGTTSIGVDARFGVSDNLSVRPFIFFPSGGTVFGSSLTYDFETSRSSKLQITPFLGGGVSVGSSNSGGSSTTTTYFTGGADFGVTDSVDLKAALDVPLSSNNSSTNVRLGAGFKF
jgi:opacity protein-like surface antigen